MAGLITRVGQWLDERWEEKATVSQFKELRIIIDARVGNLENAVQHLDVSDVKTRIERLELYSGMTRKVDPGKPPVVKSAFSM